jgi:hypothetical protein
MGNLGIGWLRPHPILLWKQRSHRIDVTVVRRALYDTRFACGTANYLHEQHPKTALRLQPLMQLL